MSDCPKLSELLVALEKLSWSDLKLLAPHLSSHDLFPLLEDIERDYQGRERFVHALRGWLDRDVDASWENVVSALRVIDKNVLASNIEKKHCGALKSPSGRSRDVPPGQAVSEPPGLVDSVVSKPPGLVLATYSVVEQASHPLSQTQEDTSSGSTVPSAASLLASLLASLPPPHLSTTVSLDEDLVSSESCGSHLQEISFEATYLQERFVCVLINTKVCFMTISTNCEEFLTKFKITLTTLPLSKKYKHLLFLKTKKDKIMKAKDINEIFDIIDPYWNYVDYAFLDYIIKEFGSTDLKDEMKKYILELEIFEKKTSVYDFYLAVTDNRNFPADLNMVTVTQGMDPKKCSLYEVRQFKNAVIHRSTLNEYAVFLKSVSCSSIKIILAVPLEVYYTVYNTLDVEFMNEHNLKSLQFMRQTNTKEQSPVAKRPERRLRLQGYQLFSSAFAAEESRHDNIMGLRFGGNTVGIELILLFNILLQSEPSSLSLVRLGRLLFIRSINVRHRPMHGVAQRRSEIREITPRSPPILSYSVPDDPSQAIGQRLRDVGDIFTHLYTVS